MVNVIIIPVHNQLAYLKKCVASVIKHTKDYELIIVDDGSTELDMKEWLSENEGIFTLLINETAQGFSNACNKGIQYAMNNFDFYCLCLLNSDAETITENWFDKVNACFESDEKIGIAGVVSNNAMTQTIHDVNKYMKKIDEKPTLYCHLIHGFCYFISKKLIYKIGMLDEFTFPHYGSEDDYSMKSLRAGFNNIIVGSVMVLHNNETSYTHQVRADYLKYSMPNFLNRWGRSYINDCGAQATKIGKHLNNI